MNDGDIQCSCPHCQQHLEAPAEMAGQTVDCPGCGKQTILPSPVSIVAPAPGKEPGSQYKACPFCAEQILSNVYLCKYCGEFLDGRKGVTLKATNAPPAEFAEPEFTQRSAWSVAFYVIGLLSSIIGGVCIIISLFLFAYQVIPVWYGIVLLGAGLQSIFWSFLIDVFTDIRWFLKQLVDGKQRRSS
jgi:hypothetical protein